MIWKIKVKHLMPKSIFCCWDFSHSYTPITFTYVHGWQKWTFDLLGSYNQLKGSVAKPYKNLLLLGLQDAIVILYNQRIQIKTMQVFCLVSLVLGGLVLFLFAGFLLVFCVFFVCLFLFGLVWFGLSFFCSSEAGALTQIVWSKNI